MSGIEQEDRRYLRWSFSPSYGQAMIRVHGRFYALKAPWCRPLFSERYRHGVRVISLSFGWRVTIRDVPTSTQDTPDMRATNKGDG